MRKTIIALFALAAVGLVQPTMASARGGSGGGHGGGGGGHGGGLGGGGFHGGGGGGFHGGFAGGGFHSGGFNGGFHRRAFVGFGPTTTDTIPTAWLAYPTCPGVRLIPVFAQLAQPFQPSPIWPSGRPTHRSFRGLLDVHARCGLHTRAVTNS
jgi:hypothetical protein